jgi:hypothetical protein
MTAIDIHGTARETRTSLRPEAQPDWDAASNALSVNARPRRRSARRGGAARLASAGEIAGVTGGAGMSARGVRG